MKREYDIGLTVLGICENNEAYEDRLTEGKAYMIATSGSIVDLGMLCCLVDDNGDELTCSIDRFGVY